MLDVRGISVFYGHIRALTDVSFDVREGEVVALVGSNGAGKSTTLRTISGLMRPHQGEIALDGRPISQIRPDRIVRSGDRCVVRA